MPLITTRHYYETPIPAPEPAPQPRRSRAEQARINGAKSKGPITQEGKAIVSQNARKHGLAAKLLLVDQGHEEDFNEIKDGLIYSLKPQTEAEDLVIDALAKVAWKIRQAENMEFDLLRDNLEQGDSIHSAFSYDPASLMLLSTYQSRLARRLHKLFDEFRKLQKETIHPLKSPVSFREIDEAHRARIPESLRDPEEKICTNKPNWNPAATAPEATEPPVPIPDDPDSGRPNASEDSPTRRPPQASPPSPGHSPEERSDPAPHRPSAPDGPSDPAAFPDARASSAPRAPRRRTPQDEAAASNPRYLRRY